MTDFISAIQPETNRRNARHATGSFTEEGEHAATPNTLEYGLLAQTLILRDEDPVEYQSLLDEMIRALRPVSGLEQTLVEDFTATLWRHLRLVRAESARIELERKGSG
ncbi:MAG: hypothetical protein R3202_04300 [Candidatus Competibacterales bacterium]|nr:hypothetical protein [Candidatus Competibacterales bacterium]